MTIDGRYKVVTDGAVHGAGVMCWWEIHGSVDHEGVNAALEKAGLDPPRFGPKAPSLEQCLTTAVRQHCGERRATGVLALRRAGAWYLIEASVAAETADLDIAAFARLRLAQDGAGQWVLARRMMRPGREAFVAQVSATFRAGMEAAMVHETSSWLSRVHQKALDGVRLRDAGGIYFVPQPQRETWKKFWEVIASAGAHHTVWGVDAMPTEDTVRVVLDAVSRDVERTLAEAGEAFDAPEGITTRGANAVGRKLEHALERLERYDGILGDRLDAMREKLDASRGLLGVTRLRAAKAVEDGDEG